MGKFMGLIVTSVVTVSVTVHVAAQTPADAALIAKAKGIHDRVIKLDTHNDIDPSLFTPACNYTMQIGRAHV